MGERIDLKSIGEKLAQLRGKKSQAKVAKDIGISASALGMYEQGRRMPRDEVKIKIANYYKVPVAYIFYAT